MLLIANLVLLAGVLLGVLALWGAPLARPFSCKRERLFEVALPLAAAGLAMTALVVAYELVRLALGLL